MTCLPAAILVLATFAAPAPTAERDRCAGGPCQTGQTTAAVHGTVTAIGGTLRLPGATVVVRPSAGGPIREVITDAEGRYQVGGLAPGPAEILVSLDGFRPAGLQVLLIGGQDVSADADLSLAGVSERVDVVQSADDIAMATSLGAKDTLDGSFVQRSAVTEATLQGALAALPGVVRTPEGLSIRGGRPSQSSVQIGTAALVDPATGIAPLRLPVDAVSSVEVLPNPYAVEFGRFSSGVTLINTRQGGDRWHVTANNFDPGFRTKRKQPLKILGISSFAPRFGFGGPLGGDRLRVAGSFQYRYTYSDVRSRPQDELQLQQYLSGLLRFDGTISARQSVTVILSAFPERRTSVNLDTFTPPEATFDQRQQIYNAVLAHSATFGGNAVLASTVQWSRYHAHAWPHGAEPMQLAPDGVTGNYYADQRRETDALQWTEALSVFLRRPTGEHLFKLGIDLLDARFAGTTAGRLIRIVRADGTRSREIAFAGPASQRVSTTDLALFAQDRWRPTARLILEAGLRVDHDGVLGRTNLTPRAGAAWTFGPAQSWSLRGGAGLFFERPPSSAKAFEQFERRVVGTFGADGVSLVGPAVAFGHRAAPGLRTPRSLTWNLDVGRQMGGGLSWRIGVLQRRGRHELVVDPRVEGARGELMLTSDGRSQYREAEVSATWAPTPTGELRLSYVYASAEGDLNAFSASFGADRDPLVRPNEYGPLPGDVRHRLVARGHARIRERWFAEAVLDWRTGFPFSALDDRRDFAGPRNRAGRFPAAAILGFAVERQVTFRGWRPWIGLRVSNALNAFAPSDVQQNLASPNFGGFYDSVPRRAGVIVRFER